MGQKVKKGQRVPLSVIEGTRDTLERLLVEDMFRPNSEPSLLDELAQRLRPKGVLLQIVNNGSTKGEGAPMDEDDRKK